MIVVLAVVAPIIVVYLASNSMFSLPALSLVVYTLTKLCTIPRDYE
jgi:hypothetical protein